MPLEPVGDAVHMNVYTNAHVSVQGQTVISYQGCSESANNPSHEGRTYPKQHVGIRMPSLGPHQEVRQAHRRSSGHLNQSRPADAAQPALYTWFSVSFKTGKEGRKRDELCLPTPEPYFVDGVGDDMLLSGQEGIKTERAAERHA